RSRSSRCICMLKALCTSGRLSVTRAIPSSSSYSRVSNFGMSASSVLLSSSNGTGGAEARDLRGREAPLAEHLIAVLPGHGGRPLDRRRRPAEAGRGGGHERSFDLDEGVAREVMRMCGRLAERQDGREADVRAFHDAAPFVARPGAEESGQAL